MTYAATMHCTEPGCEAEHKADHWNAIRAVEQGWFLQKNGDRWCPEHVPSWVSAWREHQRTQGSP